MHLAIYECNARKRGILINGETLEERTSNSLSRSFKLGKSKVTEIPCCNHVGFNAAILDDDTTGSCERLSNV